MTRWGYLHPPVRASQDRFTTSSEGEFNSVTKLAQLSLSVLIQLALAAGPFTLRGTDESWRHPIAVITSLN
jgi:hypothetical protein